jgi:hypothetical protein
VSPIERLTLIAQATGFRESMAGRMLEESLEKERDRAFAAVRRADSTKEQVERANGALDVLEFMLEVGMHIDALVEADMKAKT